MYVTIKAQKSSGCLHGHMQCLHQHTPLTEIFDLPPETLDALRSEYCRFNAHVVHSMYTGQTDSQIEAGIKDAEDSWPEHMHNSRMMSSPQNHERTKMDASNVWKKEAEKWTQDYLADDIVSLITVFKAASLPPFER